MSSSHSVAGDCVCPTDQVLAEILLGNLSPVPSRWQEHLANCEACLDTLAGAQTQSDALAATDLMIGRYQVIGMAGHGGMGAVYHAYDPMLNRDVAIKVMLAGDEKQSQLLVREARAMAQINHANVVAIHEILIDCDTAYLIMEWVSGHTLATHLSQPRTSKEIVALFVQAGHGLLAAHDKGIVHRDFKPANVLVRDDNHVLVTDFGLASQQYSQSEGGTRKYMAPEQLAGGAIDTRADQYSFALALAEALGQVEIAGASRQVGSEEIVTPALVHPKRLWRELRRALSCEAEQRFASFEAFLIALRGRAQRRRVRSGMILVITGILALVTLVTVSPGTTTSVALVDIMRLEHGTALVNASQHEAAQGYARAWLAQEPRNPAAHLVYARAIAAHSPSQAEQGLLDASVYAQQTGQVGLSTEIAAELAILYAAREELSKAKTWARMASNLAARGDKASRWQRVARARVVLATGNFRGLSTRIEQACGERSADRLTLICERMRFALDRQQLAGNELLKRARAMDSSIVKYWGAHHLDRVQPLISSARVLNRMGAVDHAERVVHHAIDLLSQNDTTYRAGLSLSNIAAFYGEKGESMRVAQLCNRAVMIAEGIAPRQSREFTRVLLNCAVLSLRVRNTARGLELLASVEPVIRQELGPRSYLYAEWLAVHATHALYGGRPHVAIDFLQEAIEIVVMLEIPHAIDAYMLQLTRALINARRLKAAQDLLEDSIARSAVRGGPSRMLQYDRRYIFCFLAAQRRDFPAAATCFRELRQLAMAMDNVLGESIALLRLSESLINQNHQLEAQSALAAARILLDKMASSARQRVWLATWHVNRGRLFYKAGDQDAALHHLAVASDIAPADSGVTRYIGQWMKVRFPNRESR